jgi:hypothetical protein
MTFSHHADVCKTELSGKQSAIRDAGRVCPYLSPATLIFREQFVY